MQLEKEYTEKPEKWQAVRAQLFSNAYLSPIVDLKKFFTPFLTPLPLFL